MKRLVVPAVYSLFAASVLSHSVAAAITGLLLVVSGILLIKERNFSLIGPLGGPAFLLAAMVLWSAVTAVMGGIPLKALGKYIYYTPLLLTPVYVMAGEHRQRLLMVLTFASLGVVAASFAQHAFGVSFNYNLFMYGRLRGVSGHPIPAAALYGTLALVSVSLVRYGGLIRGQKAFYALAAAVFMLAVVATKSRSFYIALPVAFLLMILHSKDRALALTAGVAGAALVAYAVIDGEIWRRVLTIFDTKNVQSNIQRLAMWRVAWDVGTESTRNFLFGIGYGGWSLKAAGYFERYYPSLMEASVHKHVHNIYLQSFVETGVAGLLLYISFIYSVIKGLLKKISGSAPGTFGRAFAYGILMGFAGYLIGGIFDYLHMPGILMPFFVLVSMAMAPNVHLNEGAAAGQPEPVPVQEGRD